MRILEKISELTELPKDVLCGYSSISVISNKEITITNHKGIIMYSRFAIVLCLPDGRCKVLGTGLCIDEISAEEIKISGEITGLELI